MIRNDHLKRLQFPIVDEQKIILFPYEKKSPSIDIHSSTPRISFFSLIQIQNLYKHHRIDIVKAISLHLFILILYFLFSYLFKLDFSNQNAIEISFGIEDSHTQIADVENKAPEGETEAKKMENRLKQLSKDAIPDTIPEKEHKDDGDSYSLKEPKKITNKDLGSHKTEEAKKNNKILSKKDFYNRLIEDKTKTGEKTQNGAALVRKDSTVGKIHSNYGDIPAPPKILVNSENPINNSSIPQAPEGLPTGFLNNTRDAYLAYLTLQLQLNWRLPDASLFPESLETKIQITVSAMGTLIGTPKILVSSGNMEFDNQVLISCKNAFPVTKLPPKIIDLPMVFSALYNVKGVE